MDGFTYYNIFETKGIEYIVIIAFLILIIPFWFVLNKREKIVQQIQKAWDTLTAEILKVPQGLFFSKNHTWAYLEKSGIARVGLDDFLLHVTGDVKVNHLKNPGETIKKGDLLTQIEHEGKALNIISPISGTIQYSNSSLMEESGILNQDPYEDGWIYSIKPTDWVKETNKYYLADDAKNWVRNELDRFKDFLAVTVGKYSSEPSLVAFQEGGELRNNPLSDMQSEIWRDFQKEFLDDLS